MRPEKGFRKLLLRPGAPCRQQNHPLENAEQILDAVGHFPGERLLLRQGSLELLFGLEYRQRRADESGQIGEGISMPAIEMANSVGNHPERRD